MNPLCKKVSMVECTGPRELPTLKITFHTAEDMHAASDFIRWLTSPMTPERSRGYILRQFWVHPKDWPLVQKYLRRINKRRDTL